MNKEPQIGWWIADLANLISISCAVIAQVCFLFVDHHRTGLEAVDAAFITHLGQGFGWLTTAWIAIGFVFAAICRVRGGTANEAIAYVGLFLLAAVGVVVVLSNMPST